MVDHNIFTGCVKTAQTVLTESWMRHEGEGLLGNMTHVLQTAHCVVSKIQ